MDFRAFDLKVLLNEHVDVWHPSKRIRVQARMKLRKSLSGMHVMDVEKLIDWMEKPCLFRMKDMCLSYLNSVQSNINPENAESIIHHMGETYSYLDWINDQLGIEMDYVEADFNALRARAGSAKSAGTLLAYC
ncbi:hypothetical protein ACFLRF_03135 [Candidatus Altiarchaeota archaeon]